MMRSCESSVAVDRGRREWSSADCGKRDAAHRHLFAIALEACTGCYEMTKRWCAVVPSYPGAGRVSVSMRTHVVVLRDDSNLYKTFGPLAATSIPHWWPRSLVAHQTT